MPSPEQTIAALTSRVEALERAAKKAQAALVLGPHQVGPMPGWMRAVHLEAAVLTAPPQAPGAGFMRLDLTGGAAGVSPLAFVSDGTYQRAQMGNLANYTGPNGVNSPAMYGFRALDANGNPMFDSEGLIATSTSGGFAAGPSTQAVIGAGSGVYTDITGSTFTLTITRPARIDYRIFVSGLITAGAGSGYIRGNIVGFDTTARIFQGTTGTQSSMLWYFTGPGANFTSIPAGTYTVKMEAAADVGTTWTCAQLFHQVFVLGVGA